MAYQKHNWVTDELITVDKLNNLESGAVSPTNPIDSVMKTRQTPSGVSSITDLVANALSIYGTWFTVTYISSNQSFNDAPTTDGYGSVKISTRGDSRTYLTFTDRYGIEYYSSISGTTLSPWYKSAVLDMNGNLQLAGISSISGNYTVVTTYQGEF